MINTRTIRWITEKEIRSFFNSPVAYIAITIFLLWVGWFFASPIFLIQQVTINHMLENIPLILVFITPAITMRLMAEEYKLGTIETLSIQPIEDHEIIIGKYCAAVFLLSVAILGSLIHPISLMFLGEVDWGQVVSSYIGLLLMGSAFASVGLFASSLTRNQIIAWLTGMFLCFIFFLVGKILIIVPGFIRPIVDFIGMDSHFENFAKGVIDTRDVLYFASIIIVFVYASLLVVVNKRWR
ncbi:MAG: ABC transporter permease subunit [Elusimicrobia bacterium]|nr:ABC transporter permease subunit [Elusimicrobiota bacterium]MBD3412458.1 ABC transporter permease subunit [Elusimicrobiota bacterium]